MQNIVGWFGLCQIVAVSVIALGATVTAASAQNAERTFEVQVRNVTQGNVLQLEVTSAEVLDLKIDELRMGGTNSKGDLIDSEVAAIGRRLIVGTVGPRLNVNLTVRVRCASECPVDLKGTVNVPSKSYAFVRTRMADATLRRSGAWAVQLSPSG